MDLAASLIQTACRGSAAGLIAVWIRSGKSGGLDPAGDGGGFVYILRFFWGLAAALIQTGCRSRLCGVLFFINRLFLVC